MIFHTHSDTTPHCFIWCGINSIRTRTSRSKIINSVDFDPKIVAQGKWVVSSGALTSSWGIFYAVNLTQIKKLVLVIGLKLYLLKPCILGKHIDEGRPILPPMSR
jgi:hypothetical protein